MEGMLRMYEYSQTLDQEVALKQNGINTAILNTLNGKRTKEMDRKVNS